MFVRTLSGVVRESVDADVGDPEPNAAARVVRDMSQNYSAIVMYEGISTMPIGVLICVVFRESP